MYHPTVQFELQPVHYDLALEIIDNKSLISNEDDIREIGFEKCPLPGQNATT